jgi:hypothetical protein
MDRLVVPIGSPFLRLHDTIFHVCLVVPCHLAFVSILWESLGSHWPREHKFHFYGHSRDLNKTNERPCLRHLLSFLFCPVVFSFSVSAVGQCCSTQCLLSFYVTFLNPSFSCTYHSLSPDTVPRPMLRGSESPSLVLDNWWNLGTNHYAKCVDMKWKSSMPSGGA